MKHFIFIHQGVSGEAESALRRFGFTVVRLPSFSGFLPPVCGHPDSLQFPYYDGSLLTIGDYYRENSALFISTGLRFTLTECIYSDKYPGDIILNAFTAGGVLYGKIDCLAPELTAAYEKNVYVRQGYARCSVLKLTETAFITSDTGIAAALKRNGAEVLILPPGDILLEGCRYGFIGGAAVMLRNDVCGFFGDITAYPYYNEVVDFAAGFGIETISLDCAPLTDYGGAVIITQ